MLTRSARGCIESYAIELPYLPDLPRVFCQTSDYAHSSVRIQPSGNTKTVSRYTFIYLSRASMGSGPFTVGSVFVSKAEFQEAFLASNKHASIEIVRWTSKSAKYDGDKKISNARVGYCCAYGGRA